MKQENDSSIAKKIAGTQLRILLFFVVPVVLAAGFLLIFGMSAKDKERAEELVVNLESGRITTDDLMKEELIRFRMKSKKEKVVLFDNLEKEGKSQLRFLGGIRFLYDKEKIHLEVVKKYSLWYQGVECVAEAHIGLSQSLRYMCTVQGFTGMCYLLFVYLFYRNSVKRIKRELRPIKKMTAQLGRLSMNTLHNERLDILEVRDEFKDLSIVCNEMLDRIENSYESQKQFVSNASHELRTPIAVIQGYANLLNRWGSKDPQVLSESVEALCNVSKEMQELVEKLLFLSRHDRRTIKLKKTRFDMKEVVTEVFSETEMVVTNRKLSCYVPEAVFVYGDKQTMKQAIRIFIDNAVKYTETGDTIGIACTRVGNECKVVVEDSGMGMRKKDLSNIFNRFYRADDVRDRSIAGHGLGLSIAKLIIISHSGRIHIRTQYQKGTAFSFYLPLF